MPKIGAHVSAAGGLYNCFENAKRIGAECVQIFGASPRTWSARNIPRDEVEKFKEIHKQSKIDPVYLHAAYLVNLASSSVAARKKSIKSLIDHLAIAEIIGARGLIFHLGSSERDTEKTGIKRTVEGMREVLKKVPGKSHLIMETSSGGGYKIGDTLEEIAKIFDSIRSKRVSVCLDTAHVFEAGQLQYSDKKEIKKYLDLFDRLLGLSNLEVIHINDSKTKFDSRHDRHENLGQGYIGLKGLREFAREKRLHDKPFILEVPGFKDDGPDRKNINLLKSIVV